MATISAVKAIEDGKLDIAMRISLEKMMTEATGRQPLQRVYLWAASNKTTTQQYQPPIDGPDVAGACPVLPDNEELVPVEINTKQYLEVGIIFGNEPDKYVAKGQSRDKQREQEKKQRGTLRRDTSAMRVFIPVTEHCVTQAKFYVGCRPREGRLFPRIIPISQIFFYAEFWDGVDVKLPAKKRLTEVIKACKQHAALNQAASNGTQLGQQDLDQLLRSIRQTLTLEIRVMILRLFLNDLPLRGKAHYEVDPQEGELSVSAKQVRYAYVDEDGITAFMMHPLAKNTDILRDLLLAMKYRFAFHFRTTHGIPSFSARLRTLFHGPHKLPRVDVRIDLLSPRNPAVDSLCSWNLLDMAHGYTEGIRQTIQDGMRHLQCLIDHPNIEKVGVSVMLWRPWRDYRELHGVTKLLRTEKVELEVMVDPSAWAEIPDKELHIGLTVASIKGLSLQLQSTITSDQARTLCSFGCRGFRTDFTREW